MIIGNVPEPKCSIISGAKRLHCVIFKPFGGGEGSSNAAVLVHRPVHSGYFGGL